MLGRHLPSFPFEADDPATLGALVSRSNESVLTLRAICHDLRPPLLSNNPTLALKALVDWLDAQSLAPIHIEVAVESPSVSEDNALDIPRLPELIPTTVALPAKVSPLAQSARVPASIYQSGSTLG